MCSKAWFSERLAWTWVVFKCVRKLSTRKHTNCLFKVINMEGKWEVTIGPFWHLWIDENSFAQWQQVFYSFYSWFHSNYLGIFFWECFILFYFWEWTWVYFLKQKLKVFVVFKKFKAFCETQSKCLLKTLITDYGKEYTWSEFHLFCDDMEIEHQLTVTYSPQQNGVS